MWLLRRFRRWSPLDRARELGRREAQRPMRLATYTVAPDAECGVYFFGSGQGGSVEANLDRWIGQFLQADGKPSKARPRSRSAPSTAGR